MTNVLTERLQAGSLICAEGYVFELERRGYLQAGAFVPEAVLDHPEVVEQLHREFAHAGSDVIEALTYYAHEEKLRAVDKAGRLEELNRTALRVAAKVAREHDALLAGNICNTNIYDPNDRGTQREIRSMFDAQVGWAAEARADYIIAETLSWTGEALIALEAIREMNLPAVVTLAVPGSGKMLDGHSVEECCKQLEQSGAQVVGLNCFRGPSTMLPLTERIRQAVSCDVASLPVPYRTTRQHPTFLTLEDPGWDFGPEGRPFPTALEPFSCNRYEMAVYAKTASEMGVRYLGICCGAGAHHVRAMAEALGRQPPASRYSPDLKKHAFFGEGARKLPELTGNNTEETTAE